MRSEEEREIRGFVLFEVEMQTMVLIEERRESYEKESEHGIEGMEGELSG